MPEAIEQAAEGPRKNGTSALGAGLLTSPDRAAPTWATGHFLA
jgi:hypothetical protein